MNLQSLNSKALKNLIIYGIGQAINIITPLLITPYLIYTCGLDKFGVIAIAQSMAFIFIVIIDYSSYIKGVKEISLNRNNFLILEKVFGTISFSKLLLFTFVLFILLILVFTVPYFFNERVMILLSFVIVLGQTINPTWFFQGLENFKWITILNLLSKIIYIVGIFLFIKKPEDYIYANFWLGFGLLVASFISAIYIIIKYKINLTKTSFSNIKEYLKTDFSFCISQIFFAIRNYSPVLVIGFISGDYIAGQFRVIEQIINVFRTYLQMFFKFSYSYVCFEVNKNIKNGLLFWKKYNGVNLIFVCVLLFLVFVFSEEILTFFKVKSSLLLMNNLLKTAIFIPVFIGISLSFEQLLFSLEKNKEYIKTTIFITILSIFLLVFATKYYGLLGAFLLLFFTEICLIVIYWILLKKYFYNPHKT